VIGFQVVDGSEAWGEGRRWEEGAIQIDEFGPGFFVGLGWKFHVSNYAERVYENKPRSSVYAR
jgi:hypothetical protein